MAKRDAGRQDPSPVCQHPRLQKQVELRLAGDGSSRRQALVGLLRMIVAGVSPLLVKPEGAGVSCLAALVPNAGDRPDSQRRAAFFSPQEMALVARLADLIIPADHVAPGARAARVEGYVDFVVASATAEERKAWREGLAALSVWCRQQTGQEFLSLSPSVQEQLLGDLAPHEFSPRSPGEQFFARLKHAVAIGFYTSKIGLQDDLKYQGNTYVEGPATCDDHFQNRGDRSGGALGTFLQAHPKCGGAAEPKPVRKNASRARRIS